MGIPPREERAVGKLKIEGNLVSLLCSIYPHEGGGLPSTQNFSAVRVCIRRGEFVSFHPSIPLKIGTSLRLLLNEEQLRFDYKIHPLRKWRNNKSPAPDRAVILGGIGEHEPGGMLI